MPNNDIVLIDGIIDELLADQNLPDKKENRGKVFERFAIGELLKNYDLNDKELSNGIVDGQDDGGIDGFYIFLNGNPILEATDYTWPKRSAELEVYIFTCKHHDTYELGPMESLDSTLSEVFDLRLATADFKSNLNASIIKKRNDLIYAYRKIAAALTKCTIHITYISRGDSSNVAPNIVAKGEKIGTTCASLFTESDVNVSFCGASELIKKYRKKRNALVSLRTSKCFQYKSDFVALVSLRDYFNFITDEDGKLKRYYFEENVRDYLGENRTNIDIARTLEDPESPDFWLLNNGITILSSHATLYDSTIDVENVQIVNGLQTTNTLYQHYCAHPEDQSQRLLLVKIICSTEETVRNQIIQATNNQSQIPLYSLHATDKIQKDIEDILLAHELYYERRTNYYKNQGCPEEKIFAPLYLAAGYVALVLKLPHRAATLKSKFMNKPQQYEKVFSDKTDLRVWPKIAIITRRVDSISEKHRTRLKSSTENYLKTVRPIVSILVVGKLLGKLSFGERDLLSFNIALLTDEIVEQTVVDVIDRINQDKQIRTIKDIHARKKMNEIICGVAQQYGLTDFITIEKRQDIILDDHVITDDFLDLVKQELPEQPWPAGVHKTIAGKLGCSNSKVYRSIDALIEKGYFREQKDGVLL